MSLRVPPNLPFARVQLHVASFRDTWNVCGTAVWRSNLSAGLYAVLERARCTKARPRALRASSRTPVVQAALYAGEDLA